MTPSEWVDVSTDLDYLFGNDAATDLIDIPGLALRAGVARVLVKAEWQRPLGNFKSLGGILAGLRVLMRHCGSASIAELLDGARPPRDLPRLICASDGNHGLAVAAAARRAATTCSIYLPRGASRARVARIEAQGAVVITVPGTYDDAVDAAEAAAMRGEGLLVPDTSQDPHDVVVRDVMAGYSRIARELAAQFLDLGEWPTHVLVQAGVGGLAAALVRELAPQSPGVCRWIAVEPANAACVTRAMAARRPVRIDGTLETAAEMLSCGLASAAALDILQAAGATALPVDEAELRAAVEELRVNTGIETTPSGAAGIAGLLRLASRDARSDERHVGATSRVLVLVTEGPVPTH